MDSEGHPETIHLEPIGRVHNNLRPGVSEPRERAARSVIELAPVLQAGLAGLEPGGHVVIVFAFDRSSDFTHEHLLQHPQGDRERPRRGVFTLRSPLRPNPIGLTTVRVLEVQGNRLVVSGLDAFNGTPVLDIKPYVAWLDEPTDSVSEE